MTTRLMDEKQFAAHQAKFGHNATIDPAQQRQKNEAMRARLDAAPMAKKRPKYGNEVQIVDGIRMASKKEARRYRELGFLLKAGEIDFLCRQCRFRLPGGVEFVADFFYGEICPDRLVVEDVKSPSTAKNAAYRIKKRQMLSEHGIEVVEV